MKIEKDWYDFKNLSCNIEGARANFEVACCNLLYEKFPNKLVCRINPNPGDDGIDIIIGNINKTPDIYQCKFYLDKIDSSQKNQIRKSYKRAIESNKYNLKSWTLLIPKVLTIDELKWWDNWKIKQERNNPNKSNKIKLIDGDGLILCFKKYQLYEEYFEIPNSKLEIQMAKNIQVLVDKLEVENYPQKKLTQSELVLDKIVCENLIYVKNKFFEQSKTLLEKNNCCLISGSPGVGKTTTAGALSYLYVNKGYEFIYISNGFNELQKYYNPQKNQIIFFDDFLGMVSLSKEIKESDLRAVSNILQDIIRGNNSKIVLTTREYIFNNATIQFDIQNRFLNFLKKCTIIFNRYSIFEKAKILFNHIKISDLQRNDIDILLKNENFIEIITHKNFSPRIVDWMTSTYTITRNSTSDFYNSFMANLENPVEIWKTVFEDLTDYSKYLLLRMAFSDGVVNKNVAMKFIATTVGSKKDIFKIEKIFRDSIIELKNSMITIISTKDEQIIRFLNPSVLDYILFYMQDKSFILNNFLPLFNNEYSLIINIYKFSLENNNRYIVKKEKYPGYKQLIFEMKANYSKFIYNSFVEYLNNTIDNKEKINSLYLQLLFGYYLEYEKCIDELYPIMQLLTSNLEIITLDGFLCIVELPNINLSSIFSKNKLNIENFLLHWENVKAIDTFMKIYKIIFVNISIDINNISKKYYETEKVFYEEIDDHFSLELIQYYLEILDEFGKKFHIDTEYLMGKFDSNYEEIRSIVNIEGGTLDEENLLLKEDIENDFDEEIEYYDEYDINEIRQLFNNLENRVVVN